MNHFLFSMLLVIPVLITISIVTFWGMKVLLYISEKWAQLNIINSKLSIFISISIIFALAIGFPKIITLLQRLSLENITMTILSSIFGLVFISIQLILVISVIGKLLQKAK